MRIFVIILAILALLSLRASPATAGGGDARAPAPVSHEEALRALAPPPGRLMMGVFPGGFSGEEDDITLAQVKRFEKLAGARAAWVMFSSNWYRSRRFPARTARWIRAHGAVPWIRLMLRPDAREDHAPGRFSTRAIAAGRFDAELKAWGRAAARFATPLIVEYGTEMNGRWFPWNGVWNGGARRGPARFIAAWRRIVNLMRGAGASNVIWVFHVNHADDPGARWNHFERYYPGDEHVDWLGVSIYSMLAPYEKERTDFAAAFRETARRFARMAPGKPMLVVEMGTDTRNRREPPAPWAARAFSAMLKHRARGDRPPLLGFAWWNERWENGDDPARATDLRLRSSPPLARAFRARLKNRLWRPDPRRAGRR